MNLQEQQKEYLKNNAAKIKEFEWYMSNWKIAPLSPNNTVQLVNNKFYEWEFLITYNSLWGNLQDGANYSQLIESFMWDMVDAWKDKGNSFSSSILWNMQQQRNETALIEARKRYKSFADKTSGNMLIDAFNEVTQKVSNIFSGATSIIVIGLILYGISVLKR